MRRVILESPYAGDVKRNVAYARRAMLDSLQRGEAPMASHLLYPQVLDDADADQRALGIEAGLAWGSAAIMTVVYADLGISRGMQLGIERALISRRQVVIRSLNVKPSTVWKHYKGGRYLVLGIAPPAALIGGHELSVRLGLARHSETGETWEVGMMSCAPDLLAECQAERELDPLEAIEPLVVYVPFYEVPGLPMAVRPLRMWNETVEVETAYGKTAVPRFALEVRP